MGGPYSGIPVNTAFAIDKKMDDGLPMSGNVTAEVLTNDGIWYVNYAASGACCTG